MADEFRLKGGTIYLYRSGVLIRSLYYTALDVYQFAASQSRVAIIVPSGHLHAWWYDPNGKSWGQYIGFKKLPVPLNPDLKIEWRREDGNHNLYLLTKDGKEYRLRGCLLFRWWKRVK